VDVSERQAALNTQIRFHNYGAALPLAYALRLELQLMNKRNDRQNEQLERVELTIRQLERLNEPFYTKATRWLWDRFVEKSTEEPLPPIYEEAESPLTVSQDKEDT
jgi:hypothetical protein